MAGNMMGMNPDAVENMGRQMQQVSDQIKQQIIPQIDRLVNQIPAQWNGKDAQQFQQWWQGQHRKHLLTVSDDLRGLGQSALNNAKEQRDVSGR